MLFSFSTGSQSQTDVGLKAILVIRGIFSILPDRKQLCHDLAEHELKTRHKFVS